MKCNYCEKKGTYFFNTEYACKKHFSIALAKQEMQLSLEALRDRLVWNIYRHILLNRPMGLMVLGDGSA